MNASVDLIRQSLLQDDVLPISDALLSEHIELAFEAVQVSFGESATGDRYADKIVYSMGVTLWAMLSVRAADRCFRENVQKPRFTSRTPLADRAPTSTLAVNSYATYGIAIRS